MLSQTIRGPFVICKPVVSGESIPFRSARLKLMEILIITPKWPLIMDIKAVYVVDQ